MLNLWGVFSFTILAIVIAIISIISMWIIKPKNYIFGIVFMSIMAIGLTVGGRTYIIDLVEKKTTYIVAVYVDASRSATFGATDIVFESEDGKISLLAPRLEKLPAKLEKGKLYKITYFNNTKVIKEFILLC